MNRKVNLFLAALLVVAALALTGRSSRAADDAPPSTAQQETWAAAAFNRGSYSAALPMLKNLAEALKDDPKRLGPIQEKIRVCEKALAAVKANPAVGPAAPAMTAERRTPHPAPKPGEMLEMGIKDLGNFEYEQEHGGNIPADVRRLSGAKVRLRGFMVPMDQAENVTQFALVPSLFICCLGGPPQIQHTVVATCPKGKAVGYCPDEIVVEGTLTVEEKKDDTYIISIFDLAITSVKPAAK